MSHQHNHNHHGHNYNRSFAIGVLLNIVFVAVEAGYGVLANSLALIADAGHNLSDVVSLLLAWGASAIARKAASERRTYGFQKVTVMASLISAILLLVALGGIAWEALGRFLTPQPVEGLTVIVVAALAVVINTVTALLFIKGQRQDLNIRAAFLHMAADAGVSLGVVIAGIVVLAKGWLWVDPVVTLVIVAVIFLGTWSLLKESINYAIDAVPANINIVGIKDYLMAFEQVNRIHDLHVWPLSTTEIALTVHVVVDDDRLDNAFLHAVQHHLHEQFGINHATIQIESSRKTVACHLDNSSCP